MRLRILVECYKCKRQANSDEFNQQHWYEPVYIWQSDSGAWLQTQLCPRCAPKLSLRRWARRFQWRLGRLSHIVGSPGYGSCHRCRTSWEFVLEHSTQYQTGSGCFPLCERCWADLGTPERRMPYYRELWNEWVGDSRRTGRGNLHNGRHWDDIWRDIEQAVKAEQVLSDHGAP